MSVPINTSDPASNVPEDKQVDIDKTFANELLALNGIRAVENQGASPRAVWKKYVPANGRRGPV